MHIQRLFELICQVLDLLLLLEQLLLKQVDLPLEVRDAGCFLLGVDQLTLELLYLVY